MIQQLGVGALALLVLAIAATAENPSGSAPDKAIYSRLAEEMEANLQTHILKPWYPQAVDSTHGGFIQNFSEDWKKDNSTVKSVVYQCRLTWVAAEAALKYPSQAEAYRRYSLHGLAVLNDVLWDPQYGGLYWEVDAKTPPRAGRGGEKHLYGMSFGIYASAACYRATHDPKALDLAKRIYAWLEEHGHDAKNGGYYEAFSREGKPILSASSPGQNDPIGTHYGYKSMNSHIHLLEALTALYEVQPDAPLKKRLDEIFHVVRDKVAVEPGCLSLYFTPEWRPIPDHDSFGHDIETAYLLVEASHALGRPEDERTWKVARSLVDHGLAYGWDEANGGFYDHGTAFGPPIDMTKVWWTQAEGLNVLLLMHERYGKETPTYWNAFRKEWDFIQKKQVDHKNGGWYTSVSREGAPVPGQSKSDAWKDPYHQGRALLNVTAALRRLAGG
jgi:mannobiose 2-epimerase